VALFARLLSGHTGKKSSMSSSDFSAAALLQQQYSEPPQIKRPVQALCQLHTATVTQWLGLGSTQLQVRVFQALQHEAEERPQDAVVSATSLAANSIPPAILPNGVLIYWRCSDGEGSLLRDSAGCGRYGTLVGNTSWQGPLPADEPLELSDDWGTPLFPNYAISLGPSGVVKYVPAEGSEGTDDRQMLSLVGGSRTDGAGAKHLRLARAAERDSDDEGETPTGNVGWTVEVWLRLSDQAKGELMLFSRASQSVQGT